MLIRDKTRTKMRKKLFLIICCSMITYSFLCAQQNIVITKPQLEFKDNNIIVEYDILNSQESESFRIWLDVIDSEGNNIQSNAVSGDVGNYVSGGKDKKIYWNLTADNIYIDAQLSIKVNAEVTKESTATNPDNETENAYAGIKRGGLLVQSLVFPGWGLSRINKGPHWLKGVVGYGIVAGAVVYNVKALSNYNAYLETSDVTIGNELFALSNRQDKISEGLMIAAAGIWVVDLIWTAAGSAKVKRPVELGGVSVGSALDPVSNAPLLAFKYSF